MNAQTLPNGGYCYDWTHRMAGLSFEGRAERIEFVKDRRIVDRNETCTPSTLMWTHQPEGAGTGVTVSEVLGWWRRVHSRGGDRLTQRERSLGSPSPAPRAL